MTSVDNAPSSSSAAAPPPPRRWKRCSPAKSNKSAKRGGDGEEEEEDDDDDDYCDSLGGRYVPPSRGASKWRSEEKEDAPSPRVRGVRPSRFHRRPPPPDPRGSDGRAGPRPPTPQEALRKVLDGAQERLVRNRKREATLEVKIRRAAYRDVTSLRTWPLQDMALADLDELMAEHLGAGRGAGEEGGGGDGEGEDGRERGEGSERGARGDGAVDRDLRCEFESDSTAVSTSELDEPKIPRRPAARGARRGRGRGGRGSLAESLSPRKCTERAAFAEEFLGERSIRPGVPVGGSGGGGGGGSGDGAEDEEGGGAARDGSGDRSDGSDDGTHDGSGSGDGEGGARGGGGSSRPPPFLPALWSMEPRIFSVERSSTGKRRYVVGNLGRFLDLYWRKTDPRARHYYELIREGSPCRLYFDLEFERGPNPEITEEASEDMMEEFVAEMCAELAGAYKLGGVDRTCVVDLDSSTRKKFSRHLIVHLPGGELFADALACGSFVRAFVGRLADEIGTGRLEERSPTLARHLFVNAKPPPPPPTPPTPPPPPPTGGSDGGGGRRPPPRPSPKTCFVDLGVYTRNRLFRLLGSAKYGKPPGAALRVAPSNAFPFPPGFGNDRFYVPERGGASTLPSGGTDDASGGGNDDDGDGDDGSDSDDEERSYRPGPSDPELARFRSGMDWSDHAEALASTLVVPVNVSKIAFPILPDPEDRSGIGVYRVEPGGPIVGARGSAKRPPAGGADRSRRIVRGASPFPPLDAYVADVLGSRGGTPASIRAWSIDDLPNGLPGRITYQMKDNRYCENVGREHRSNKVMYKVDFVGMYAYQMCHDPDCRAAGFRGRTEELPDDLQDELREILFDMELGMLDEPNSAGEGEAVDAPPRREPDDDDEEFEKALMALDISGRGAPPSSRGPRSGGDETGDHCGGNEGTYASVDGSCPTATSTSEGEEWDEALSQALCDNPNLFP